MIMTMTMTMMTTTSIKASFVSSEATVDEIIIGSRLVHKLKQILNHCPFLLFFLFGCVFAENISELIIAVQIVEK